jgi:hypothetical protein
MKTILLFIFAICATTSGRSQNMWNDYIIGKPMQGYAEAKKATADSWGLNYKAIFAGCIISEETRKTQEECEQNNTEYFRSLEYKFGKDWLKAFNLDVRKEMNRTVYAKDTGMWVEPVVGKPFISHFEAKKAIAKKWGIHYKAEFLGCQVSDESRAEVQQIMDKSNQYIVRLNTRLGDEWQEAFNREVKLEMAKQNAEVVPVSDDPLKVTDGWVDCIMGKPNTIYIDTRKSVAKEWKITYVPYFMGCKRNKKMIDQKKKITATNEQYFKKLSEKYGADWRIVFDQEVEKAMNEIKNSNKQ